MRLSISILGTELLAIELGPAVGLVETETVTGATSTLEFGFAPEPDSYWGEDRR